MFNKSIKEEFLKTVNHDNKAIEIFNKSSKGEHKLSKDLFEFKNDEVTEIFSTQEEFILINDYVDWALCQGVSDHTQLNFVHELIDDAYFEENQTEETKQGGIYNE